MPSHEWKVSLEVSTVSSVWLLSFSAEIYKLYQISLSLSLPFQALSKFIVGYFQWIYVLELLVKHQKAFSNIIHPFFPSQQRTAMIPDDETDTNMKHFLNEFETCLTSPVFSGVQVFLYSYKRLYGVGVCVIYVFCQILLIFQTVFFSFFFGSPLSMVLCFIRRFQVLLNCDHIK